MPNALRGARPEEGHRVLDAAHVSGSRAFKQRCDDMPHKKKKKSNIGSDGDGFSFSSAHLLKSASEALQRQYWRALVTECYRSRSVPAREIHKLGILQA